MVSDGDADVGEGDGAGDGAEADGVRVRVRVPARVPHRPRHGTTARRRRPGDLDQLGR